MTTSWTPEPDEQPKPDYQVKAHIALEDSDTQSWGIAKDTMGSLTWEQGGGLVVGTWSRSPVDGLVHVFLETPLQALVDKATVRFAEYAEKRRTVASMPKTSRTCAPKVEMPAPPSEELVKITSLRKLLQR